MLDLGLKDHTAIITGANSGIGEAVAKTLASQGVKVVLHFLDDNDIREIPGVESQAVHRGRAGAEAVRADIVEAGGQAECLSGDLNNPETVEALFRQAAGLYGPISILVNNAAHCESPDTLATTTAGSIERTFRINTQAPVLLTQEFVRRYDPAVQPFGRIVGLSTDAAQVFAGQIAYGASKAAWEAFTRSIAVEIADQGITCNTVAPGPIQTGVYPEEFVEEVSPEIPLRRFGTPQEIADIVLFLCSKQASYLTGQVIKVSGGHCL